MPQTYAKFRNGIPKESASEIAQFVDERSNSWICDKDAVAMIDRNRPFEEQNVDGCQVMPFDHGG
jgi:hypothetical protein